MALDALPATTAVHSLSLRAIVFGARSNASARKLPLTERLIACRSLAVCKKPWQKPSKLGRVFVHQMRKSRAIEQGLHYLGQLTSTRNRRSPSLARFGQRRFDEIAGINPGQPRETG